MVFGERGGRFEVRRGWFPGRDGPWDVVDIGLGFITQWEEKDCESIAAG